jgi:hypothetical protein
MLSCIGEKAAAPPALSGSMHLGAAFRPAALRLPLVLSLGSTGRREPHPVLLPMQSGGGARLPLRMESESGAHHRHGCRSSREALVRRRLRRAMFAGEGSGLGGRFDPSPQRKFRTASLIPQEEVELPRWQSVRSDR